MQVSPSLSTYFAVMATHGGIPASRLPDGPVIFVISCHSCDILGNLARPATETR
jgi:hypothetical protein